MEILYPNISEMSQYICRCVMFSHWAGCNIVPNSKYGAQQYITFQGQVLFPIYANPHGHLSIYVTLVTEQEMMHLISYFSPV